MSKAPAIGIDLGTSNSCVAVFQHGRVEIIPNDQGNKVTPSCVAFTDSGRLIGDPAKNQVTRNPTNTIFHSKRLIGCPISDSTVTSDRKYWPYQLVDRKGCPNYKVTYKGEETLYCPEEILFMILSKMKDAAEAHVGRTITEAVITVPALFNNFKRQATKDAGMLAGLNILRVISESTAAVVAYGLDKKTAPETNVLVFNLGGGFLSVTVMTTEDGIFDVISTAGHNHLGGEDFTMRMVNHFVLEFAKKYKRDLTSSKRAIQRLRTACERAKITLSTSTEARIEIDSLLEGVDFYTKMTRTKFEEINDDLFQSILIPVKKALSDAKFDESQIHDIVLVGGSTRVPKIQHLLREFFHRKELNKSINPDEGVAYGAAIQAAILSGDRSDEVQGLMLIDVTPLTLGIQSADGKMIPFIKRNSHLPTKVTQTFSTSLSNSIQIRFPVLVYEGESATIEDNYPLGYFEFPGIKLTPAGTDITFDIDRNSTLVVSATDKSTGREEKITITNNKSRLSAEDIERILSRAEKFKAEDAKEKERMAAKNRLEGFIFSTKTSIEKVASKFDEVMEWLDSNHTAERDEFEFKMEELRNALKQLH